MGGHYISICFCLPNFNLFIDQKIQFINFSETHPDRFLFEVSSRFYAPVGFFSFAGLRGLRGKWWSCLSSSTGGESYWLIIIRLYYIRETCVETGYWSYRQNSSTGRLVARKNLLFAGLKLRKVFCNFPKINDGGFFPDLAGVPVHHRQYDFRWWILLSS